MVLGAILKDDPGFGDNFCLKATRSEELPVYQVSFIDFLFILLLYSYSSFIYLISHLIYSFIILFSL